MMIPLDPVTVPKKAYQRTVWLGCEWQEQFSVAIRLDLPGRQPSETEAGLTAYPIQNDDRSEHYMVIFQDLICFDVVN